MDNIILSNEDNLNDTKINIDSLYEQVRLNDYYTLISFNKILNRIHKRIKTTARQKNNNKCCWFVVPEVIIGIPKYDVASCIAYLIDKLKDNKFKVRYTHPNLLFISWNDWIPDYVREKVKKETGMEIDGNGNQIKKKQIDDTNGLLTNKSENTTLVTKDYKSINSYKPTGNLIYNNELLKTLHDKL
tara:strand:+ start:1192 stop:1752 length:561 start_codon:yes stop_codon:yes gene_type:complete